MTPDNETTGEASKTPIKLLRLYHFDLPDHQKWGGVWRANGVTLSQKSSEENKWRMVRVMACADGEKIGEEQSTFEVILTNYAKEVRFLKLEEVAQLTTAQAALARSNQLAESNGILAHDTAIQLRAAQAVMEQLAEALAEILGEPDDYTTTGEGHAQCKQIARETLAAYKALTPQETKL